MSEFLYPLYLTLGVFFLCNSAAQSHTKVSRQAKIRLQDVEGYMSKVWTRPCKKSTRTWVVSVHGG
jgi:hypothetical protein